MIIKKYNIGDSKNGPIGSFFNGNGELRTPLFAPLPFNITEEEIEDCATTSCGPELWFLRAWGTRMGYPIPKVDWMFYQMMGPS